MLALWRITRRTFRVSDGFDLETFVLISKSAISFRTEAKDLWDWWYAHPKNSEFKDHVEKVENEYPGSKDKLFFHMMTPFSLMDEISKDESWDLSDSVNIYMYVSFLGSGFTTALICLAIQFIVPTLLVQSAISHSSRFESDPLTWDGFCNDSGSRTGLIMNSK